MMIFANGIVESFRGTLLISPSCLAIYRFLSLLFLSRRENEIGSWARVMQETGIRAEAYYGFTQIEVSCGLPKFNDSDSLNRGLNDSLIERF